MVTAVSKVIVPVDDQEEAKQFWTNRIGLRVARDESYGDERWIELSTPSGGPVIVPTRRPDDQPRADVPETLPQSPVFFSCEDIHQTYRELSDRGVEFPAPPAQMHFGWWSMFLDQDGTRYALGQWT
jgi:lactoylglutathione lyase